MKSIATIAIAFLATTGLTMSAANNNTSSTDDNQPKKEKSEKQKTDKQKGTQRGQGIFNPFDGLNLTDAQKDQLKALAPNRDQARQQGQEKPSPEKMKEMAKERLSKIKAILTPEQYQMYLENVAVNQFMMQGQSGRNAARNNNGRQPQRPERKNDGQK